MSETSVAGNYLSIYTYIHTQRSFKATEGFLDGFSNGLDRLRGDKKTPVGVIMITAVQRERRSIAARMAALGSWEIGILERHFRVSPRRRPLFLSTSPSPNNAVFRLLVPKAFRRPVRTHTHPSVRAVLAVLFLVTFSRRPSFFIAFYSRRQLFSPRIFRIFINCIIIRYIFRDRQDFDCIGYIFRLEGPESHGLETKVESINID